MKTEKWISKNTESLKGKTIAITGSTGGIGKELCRHLAKLEASLILVDRNKDKSDRLASELSDTYGIKVSLINADLEDIDSVKAAAQRLMSFDIDVFIHNAGAYSIPRHKCSTGFDNVFMINFVSPYYIIREILPLLRKRRGRVVVVGSIAHNYSKVDPRDVDFATVKQASRVYGNAKRYLMFSLYELFKNEREVSLAVTHPGITFTNITAHYPKLIFAIIRAIGWVVA
jgi:NAD(P)-dependent dehydrogenase (short-subunit alcohol dehydrogenase family)